jgi:hypothetical protein
MLLHGSHTPGRSLLNVVKLGMLFAVALIAYIFLKKKITMDKGTEIYNILLASGLNLTLSRFALAQAAHETNGFTSIIFMSNNNAFGMKYAGQVNSTGAKNGYANYKTVNNSVADFVAWYSRHRASIFSLPLYINSLSSYVRFLKNASYFEADESEYLAGCQHFYKMYFDE